MDRDSPVHKVEEVVVATVAFSPHDAELGLAKSWGGRAIVGGLEWMVRAVAVDFEPTSGLWLAVYALSRPRARVLH